MILYCRFMSWGYLNFQVRVPVSLPLTAIYDRIRDHHNGSVSNLELWKDKPSPNNVLRNPDATLREIFKIPPDDDRDFEAAIWYKFTPIQSDCPLLLRASQLPYAEPNKQAP